MKINILVDGNWSNWSRWSKCSVSCGVGSKRRSRTCSNPSPSRFGLSCSSQISRPNLTSNIFIDLISEGGEPWRYTGFERKSYIDPSTPIFETRNCNTQSCNP